MTRVADVNREVKQCIIYTFDDDYILTIKGDLPDSADVYKIYMYQLNHKHKLTRLV